MAIDPSKFKIDPKKASEADLARALEMLEKENYRKAHIKAGEIKGSRSWAEMTDEQKQERRDYNTKHRAERNVIIQVEQIEPGCDVLPFGSELRVLGVEKLTRAGVRRRALFAMR